MTLEGTLEGDQEPGLGERLQAWLLTGYAGSPSIRAFDKAELLRSDLPHQIDIHNVPDKMEDSVHRLADMVRSDESRILHESSEADHHPVDWTRSWALRVAEHRNSPSRHLRREPRLMSVLHEIPIEACRDGRHQALDVTGLSRKTSPKACPYTWDVIMSRPIEWPDPS